MLLQVNEKKHNSFQCLSIIISVVKSNNISLARLNKIIFEHLVTGEFYSPANDTVNMYNIALSIRRKLVKRDTFFEFYRQIFLDIINDNSPEELLTNVPIKKYHYLMKGFKGLFKDSGDPWLDTKTQQDTYTLYKRLRVSFSL